MQIKIKSSVRIIKEGERKDQTPYKWLSVVADDGSEKGTEYTTFDQKPLHLGSGSIIDIGDPKTKGGKLSFDKVVSIIKEVPPSDQPTPNRKSRNGDERRSIERQVAVKVAAQLNPANLEELLKNAEVIAQWISADEETIKLLRHPPLVIEKPAPEPEKQHSYITDLENKEFDNPGKLYYNADKYFKYKKSKVDEITVGLDLNNATDRKEAWRRIINEYACSVK